MRATAALLRMAPALADPLAAYQARVAQGELVRDGPQIHALVLLRRLARTLAAQHARHVRHAPSATPEHPPETSNSESEKQRVHALELERALVAAPAATPRAPAGALLTGAPGCGKTLVADLFLASLPPGVGFRRHYHHLLLEIYATVNGEAARRAAETRAVRRGERPRAQSTPTHLLARLRSVARPHADRIAAFFRPPLPGRAAAAIAAQEARQVAIAAREATAASSSSSSSSSSQAVVQPQPPEGAAALASAALGTSTLAEYAAAWLLVSQGRVLLVDELQLLDIASAGLLARVLDAYWRLGGTVVGTSNRAPQELYAQANVQRSQLQPFLDALEAHCPQIPMRSHADFRRAPGTVENYFVRDRAGVAARVDQLVAGRTLEPASLTVYGHQVAVPRACPPSEEAGAVGVLPFHSVCAGELAGADYLALCSTFPTLVLTDVPQLTLGDSVPGTQGARDQTRRFITLIDAAYETRTRLILDAAVEIDALFGNTAPGTEQELISKQLIQSEVLSEAQQDADEGFRPNVSMYDSVREHRLGPLEAVQGERKSSLFSSEEEMFATARALSRLHQMSRSSWPVQQGAWTPLPRHVLSLWGVRASWTSAEEGAEEERPEADGESDPMGAEAGNTQLKPSLAPTETETETETDPDWPTLPEGDALSRTAREPPTLIREHHIWGVREDWGRKAGRWGKGAAVFERGQEKENRLDDS